MLDKSYAHPTRYDFRKYPWLKAICSTTPELYTLKAGTNCVYELNNKKKVDNFFGEFRIQIFTWTIQEPERKKHNTKCWRYLYPIIRLFHRHRNFAYSSVYSPMSIWVYTGTLMRRICTWHWCSHKKLFLGYF